MRDSSNPPFDLTSEQLYRAIAASVAIRALPQQEQTKRCQSVREDGAGTDIPGDYGLLLQRLGNDPATVAVLPFSYLAQNGDRIQAARIDGVAPTAETIFAFRYPAARPLFIYVKTTHFAAVPGLADFVQEFLSDRAAVTEGYPIDKGLIALPPGWLAGERAKLARYGPARP